MRRNIVLILSIMLIVSCQTDNAKDSNYEANNMIFSKHVDTFKNHFLKGFETKNIELMLEMYSDSLYWNGPNEGGDDWGDQVRNTFVNTQLHSLGIHQDHPHFVRGCPHQYRCDQCINAARLTRTRGSRDQDVRHLGEVRNNELPLDILA